MRMVNGENNVLSIHSIIVLWFLILFPSLSRADVTLTVGDGSGAPGSSENQVVVSLANPDDKVWGMQMDICNDGQYLDLSACENTSRTSDIICERIDNETKTDCPGGLADRILFVGIGDIIDTGTGPIVTLKYDVSEDAPAGECQDLSVEGIQILDENMDQLVTVSESGEFCFPTVSSTTTTTITPITISPDPLWKSHWLPLPRLIVIEGNDTHFEAFATTLDFQPPDAVLSCFPLVWNNLYIWDLIWVMPSWIAGKEDETVTLTVITEGEVVEGNLEIKLLPFILDQ